MYTRVLLMCAAAATLAVPVAAQREGGEESVTIVEDTPPEGLMSAEAWVASDLAADLDLNGVVDTADYRMWAAAGGGQIIIAPGPAEDPGDAIADVDRWLASESAADLNEDGVIDYSDFRLWVAAVDQPADGEPADVERVVLPRSAEAYVAWEYAADLNGDGVLDTQDYDLWVGMRDTPEPGDMPKGDTGDTGLSYEEWLSIYAMDMNGDGSVDQADYAEFQANPVLIMPTLVQSATWGVVKSR